MSDMKLRIFFIFFSLLILQKVFSQQSGPIALSCQDKFGNALCFTKGGSLLVYSDGRNVQIRSTIDSSLSALLSNGHKDRILALDISNDSSMIVTGGRDSLLILWDISKQRLIRKLNYHKGKVTTVRFDPSGNYIYSGSTDKRLICYSIKEDKIVFDKKVHLDDILSIDVSRDGKFLASGGVDKCVYIFDAISGDLIQNLGHFRNWIRCVRFSPNGSTLATCCDNGNIFFWGKKYSHVFELINKEKLSMRWITGIDFCDDNSSFAYSMENGTAGFRTHGFKYIYKAGHPIRMVKNQPGTGSFISFAIITSGGGVLFIKGKSLILKN